MLSWLDDRWVKLVLWKRQKVDDLKMGRDQRKTKRFERKVKVCARIGHRYKYFGRSSYRTYRRDERCRRCKLVHTRTGLFRIPGSDSNRPSTQDPTPHAQDD